MSRQLLVSGVLLLLLAWMGVDVTSALSTTNSKGDSSSTFELFYVFQDPKNYTSVEIRGNYSNPHSKGKKGSSGSFEMVAAVEYNATMMLTGWDTLTIDTVDGIPDVNQAYAAGFGEGVTARKSARQYFGNLYGTLNYTTPSVVLEWFKKNDAFMKNQIQANPNSSYWRNVELLLVQEAGVLAGLNYDLGDSKYIQSKADASMMATPFTAEMLRLLQTQGDQMDLFAALNVPSPSSSQSMEREDEHQIGKPSSENKKKKSSDLQHRPPFIKWFQTGHTHCSALVSLAPDNSDIHFGHATWGMYQMMLRVFKTYKLHYSSGLQSGSNGLVTFSSYPSVLVSIDDYYTTGGGLAVLETSFSTFNKSLYKAVNVETNLYWVRTTVANRMGGNGRDWTEIFGRLNSGTYNAQWLVLDFKLFEPKKDLKRDTFWISEQFPGLYSRQDATMYLATGHLWGSFNIPFNQTMYKLSGTEKEARASVASGGGYAMNSEQLNVRSRIWRRDSYNVSLGGLEAFMFEMQYNDYKNDPISQGNPTYTIASRGDLGSPETAFCWGAIDAKLTSYSMYVANRESNPGFTATAPPSYVYNGPTPQQGAFQWSTSTAAGCTTTPPAGMPNLYNYSWLYVNGY